MTTLPPLGYNGNTLNTLNNIPVAQTVTNVNIPNIANEKTTPNYLDPIMGTVSMFSPVLGRLLSNVMPPPVQNQPRTQQVVSEEERNKEEILKKATPFVICICIFIFLMVIALPITILVMTASYSNEIKCHSNASTPMSSLEQNVGIKTWLYVAGSVDLVLPTLVIFAGILILNSHYDFGTFIILFYPVFMIFKFAWLIVGSVLFWRDCLNLEPSPINGLMWATLIIGLLGFLPCKKRDKDE